MDKKDKKRAEEELSAGMDLRDELHEAIVSHTRRAEDLLQQHPEWINDTSYRTHAPPLHTAAAWGRDELVEQLLAAGAKVELVCPHTIEGAYHSTPLDLALFHQHSTTAQLLRQHGASSNFFAEVGSNQLEAVRALVTNQPELLRSERFFLGCTPLHFAAVVSSNAMIDLLCDLGADVNAGDAEGHSPLWYACLYYRSILVLQTLFARGAQVNHASVDGSTPLLMVCSHYETVPAVRWLLDHGADPNLTTIDRQSPLLIAVQHRVVQAVELLVERGADVEHRGADGMTARELAEAKKYSDVLRTLQIR